MKEIKAQLQVLSILLDEYDKKVKKLAAKYLELKAKEKAKK
jgi:hypothetical protein